MKDRNPSAATGRAFATIAAAAAMALGAAAYSFAQQPPQAQPQPKPAQPKPAPKQQPKQQPAPKPAEAAKNGPAAAAQPAGQQVPPLLYSPWFKMCSTDQTQPNAQEACLTAKEARLETAQPFASAAILEQQGQQKKVLRVTLPLGVQLKAGTRVVIDQGQPLQEQYFVCFPTGCVADFEISLDFVNSMKKGQTLNLQAINLQNQLVVIPLPLPDFAKANEGAPTDQQVLARFQADMQARAEDARKKFEAQQQASPKQ